MIDTDMLFASERTESREVPHDRSQDEWHEPSPHEHQEQQPIIGLPIPVQQGNQGPLLVADAVGAWAIERMHARVFLIPLWPFPTHPHRYQSLWQLLQSMDGLFLPAGIGTDWYPLWKAGEPGPESWPILWEIALAQLASYIGMPILAIADGAEKWNSALGGKRGEVPRDLEQTSPFTSPETWDRHTIRVRAQSMLATVLQPALVQQSGEQKPWALPFLPMPHQSVEHLAPGLRSCAQSEDGTVAAFERRDGAFGLGIIGRLDWGLDQLYGTVLFDAFLQACTSFDRTRQQQNGWESARETICATVSDLVAHDQSLIAVPQQTMQCEKYSRARPLSKPLPTVHGSGGRERIRQRSQQPTKEELNKIRRQRLKTATR